MLSSITLRRLLDNLTVASHKAMLKPQNTLPPVRYLFQVINSTV